LVSINYISLRSYRFYKNTGSPTFSS